MNFGLYLNLGLEHITDPLGYDHILFILAMSANYRVSEWKKLALLVTAFTVGHSISLALAMLKIVPVNAAFIEFLIPLSILMTCFLNLNKPLENNPSFKTPNKILSTTHYFIILFFGLIHGLGFSNFLKETLVENESLFTPLLAFNIGLEIGQLLILGIFLFINFIVLEILKKQARDWSIFISAAISSLSFFIFLEKTNLLLGISSQ
jgi:hypothetical protein